MTQFFSEFKEFALRGNVVDLAVGVIIGAAFNSIVTSFVNDILMPPIGVFLGGVDFSEFYVVLGPEEYESLAAAQEAGAATLNYGIFVNAVISFIITALAVYILVRVINRMRRRNDEEAAATPTTRACPYCMSEISRKARKCAYCTADVEPSVGVNAVENSRA